MPAQEHQNQTVAENAKEASAIVHNAKEARVPYFSYFCATEELKDAATHEIEDDRKPKVKTDGP
jgi:hypothetical protein